MNSLNDLLDKVKKYNEEHMDDLEKEIKSKRQLAIINIHDSWGHRYPGYSGMFITKEKELYIYQHYEIKPDFMKGDPNYIKLIRVITDDEYNEVTKQIEEKILPFKFEYKRIYDATYKIYINYNGVKKEIENHTDLSDYFRNLIKGLKDKEPDK